MLKKKRCIICGTKFWPDPRVVRHQKACSNRNCQKERHRINCGKWHKKNPDYDRENRIRSALQTDDETKKRAQVAGEPILALNEKVVRDEIGVQHFVILDELSKVQFQILRDEIRTQLWKNLQEKGKNLVSFHDTR